MSPLEMEAHIGSAEGEAPDWRDTELPDEPDDDEELAETPADVIDVLGFDPLDDD